MLTEALRGTGRAADALPPLVPVVAGRVVLPRYQSPILRLLAARRARSEGCETTVSALLEEAVTTAVLTTIQEWDSIDAALLGVRAANDWPPGE